MRRLDGRGFFLRLRRGGTLRRAALFHRRADRPPPDHRGLDSLFNHLAGFGRKQFRLNPLKICIFECA